MAVPVRINRSYYKQTINNLQASWIRDLPVPQQPTAPFLDQLGSQLEYFRFQLGSPIDSRENATVTVLNRFKKTVASFGEKLGVTVVYCPAGTKVVMSQNMRNLRTEAYLTKRPMGPTTTCEPRPFGGPRESRRGLSRRFGQFSSVGAGGGRSGKNRFV
ncbi:hypothetical protein H6P81_003877 [Aristolochia fimbriata]|uniref:Uncharacterized protein n=1 Tax=Aristolochia fimbriata TaxID=158543 RepID=A0AAV7FFW2_ARIFI|nr:hypothetical protein H6P81_003877 [Aristolochia fimbriata]